MGNASNQPSGYFETTEAGGDTWRLSWEVIKNTSNFTWTIKVKLYLNTHSENWANEFKPKIQIGSEVFEGVYGTYGYSTDFVFLMEATKTYEVTSTGLQAAAIYGESENYEGDTFDKVWGAVTFSSFSGASIKINNEWKNSMPWIKVNGQWKRCQQYIKINGQWRLSDKKWTWDPF